MYEEGLGSIYMFIIRYYVPLYVSMKIMMPCLCTSSLDHYNNCATSNFIDYHYLIQILFLVFHYN